METTIKLELPEDFNMVCDIFGVKPTDFLQKLVDDVSLPYYYSHVNEKGRWATLLFLDYLEQLDIANADFAIHEPFMDKLNTTVKAILTQNSRDQQRAEESARKVMVEWRKVVIAHRAKYLLEGLDGGG